MQIAAIIPARYESSRFPGKPLALLNGKTMIEWVYQRATQAAGIDRVSVATDDARIQKAVLAFGGRVFMTSAKCRSGTDRVAEAASADGLKDEDIVVNLQGDQPLVDPRSLEEVVRPFNEDPGVQMSTLGFPIVRKEEITDPKDVKVTFNQKGDALYFSRATIPWARDADCRHPTYKHLGVYAYTFQFLKQFSRLPEGALERIEKLEQLRALEFGYPIRVVVTAHDSPEVDLPADIGRIEAVMSEDNSCANSLAGNGRLK